MRHWINVVESYAFPEDDPKNIPLFQDMLTRVDLDEVRTWALANNWDESDLADQFLNVFNYWLRDEHSIQVSDGVVEFYRLYNGDTASIIGDNPVLLYHFTSSVRVPSIHKYGLVGDRRTVNRRQTAGVFLTTESSGPAITGYLHNALRGTRKAYGVRLSVVTTLSDLEPDPDDADITSGATQFMTDHVAPSQIVAVERA
jgi:hypothetical protein